MHLKNEAARLITINHKDGDKVTQYRILPGENPAVEVPDAVTKLDFVKALLKNGSLRKVGKEELAGDEEESDEGDVEIEALRAEAAGLGVEVSNRWGAKRLREEIAKAQPAE